MYPLWVRTSQLDQFSDKDYEDVAGYVSSLDLSSIGQFNIQPAFGDAKKRKKICRTDFRDGHNANGYGKPRKEAPPLAGQHPAYPYTTMRGLAEGHRFHANDKEDDSFTDDEDADLVDPAAYLATPDDVKIVQGYRFIPPVYGPRFARAPRAELSSMQITDITHTVVRIALEEGVTTKAPETATIAEAKEIGLKKVAQQKVSLFLSKQGVEMLHLSIFQFCNPMTRACWLPPIRCSR